MEIPPLSAHHKAQAGPMVSEAVPCTTGKVDFTLLGPKAQTKAREAVLEDGGGSQQ